MTRSAPALLLALLLLPLGGCSFGAEEPVPVVELEWAGGEARGVADASPARVFSAAALVFQRFGLEFVARESTSERGQISAKADDERSVVLRANRIQQTRTSWVSLRVGMEGDEDLSRRLLDAIFDQLRG